MAKTEAKTTDKDAAPKKRGRKWIVLAVLGVAVLGAGGGGAWWWLGRDAGTAEAAKPASARPPVFMNLEPFTVNLAEEEGEHYLQMSVIYQVADEKTVDTLKAYLPVIRNRILLLLSSKKPSDLASALGNTGVHVVSSPATIGFLEMACHNALRPFFDVGEGSVGVGFELR
ncbi:MAG: flagellar basal body-associated FliL family protein, partial [Burkholderiales bacterium]|nr:flagellar basal body-associated FliL family protein [Burkholderiales bacterium]